MASKFSKFKFSGKVFITALVATALLATEVRVRASEPTPLTSPAVSTSPTVAQASVDSPPLSKTVTPAEAKSLLKQFLRAQSNQVAAFQHRAKMELKQLKSSHGARTKDFNRREREARHLFFEQNKAGNSRRDYVKAFQERRKVLLGMIKDEVKVKNEDLATKRNLLKTDQASKLKEFKEVLGHGERPPESLWPTL